MGTFRARFTLSSTSGTPFYTGGAGVNAYHGYGSSGGALPGTGEIVFVIQGANFFLDGSGTGIRFDQLPPGFTLTPPQRLTVSGILFGNTTPPNEIMLLSCGLVGQGSAQATIGYGVYSKSLVCPVNSEAKMQVQDIAFTNSIDLTNLLRVDLATTWDNIHLGASNDWILDVIDVQGSYSIVSFSYTYTVPTALDTIGPNNIFRITSTYPSSNSLNLTGIVQNGIDSYGSYNPLDDTGVAGIALTWVNLAGATQKYFIPLRYIGVDFIKRGFNPVSPTLLEFILPPGFAEIIWSDPTIPGWPSVPITPYIYGDGTQFSGWVALSPLTITLVDASGIYRLVPGKTNDTLYDQIAPLSTNDVKIPNPYFRTGFIGG